MKINDFIWLEEIINKLETKHRLLPEEVEESFCIFHLKTKLKSVGNLFKRYESQREEVL